MNFNDITTFIAKLMKDKFTGRLILDFYEGKVSHKIKREITEMVGEEK